MITSQSLHTLRLPTALMPSSEASTAAPRLAFDALLDEIDTALIVCDEQGRLHWANSAAQQELKQGRWLQQRHGLLVCGESAAANGLRTLAAALLSAGTRMRRQVLTLAAGDERLFVSVSPVNCADGQRLVLLMLGRRNPCSPLALELLGIAHGLTPAERRVLSALVERRSPQEIADEHGVKLSTGRTQVAAAIAQAFQQNPTHLPESLYSSRVSTLIKTAESEGGYSVHREISLTDPPDVQTAPADRADPPQASSSVSRLTAIAQVHNTYILAETPSGLCLIEQHIAHERVLYEQLCDRWAIVPLALPITLPYLSEAQVEQLQRLGLVVDPFGEEVWVVRSAPEPIALRDDCTEALLELSLGGDLQTGQVAIACRTAIRNGTPLSLAEMQSLLDQWQRSRHPRTCPHGRPICLTLEESSLSRFFRRHWVIGKSHGI